MRTQQLTTDTLAHPERQQQSVRFITQPRQHLLAQVDEHREGGAAAEGLRAPRSDRRRS